MAHMCTIEQVTIDSGRDFPAAAHMPAYDSHRHKHMFT